MFIKDGGRERAVKVIVTASYPDDLNIEALAQKAWSMPTRAMKVGTASINVETFDADKQAMWDEKLLRLRSRMRGGVCSLPSTSLHWPQSWPALLPPSYREFGARHSCHWS